MKSRRNYVSLVPNAFNYTTLTNYISNGARSRNDPHSRHEYSGWKRRITRMMSAQRNSIIDRLIDALIPVLSWRFKGLPSPYAIDGQPD